MLDLGGGTGALALAHDGGDQALDLRALGHLLAGLVGESAGDDELADVLGLEQAPELADVVGALGTQTARDVLGGQALDLSGALLDHHEVEHTDVGADDAAADRLLLALALAARAVGLGAWRQSGSR